MNCSGFHWVGQTFSSCENCGRDIADHDGLGWRGELLPFDEAEQRIPMFALYTVPTDGGSARRWHESQRGAS